MFGSKNYCWFCEVWQCGASIQSPLWNNHAVNHSLSGVTKCLERQTRDQKVTGSSSGRSGRRIFFSRVSFLCWLLFPYPFHPRVTTAAHDRSQPSCQGCKWQFTAIHTCTLRTWLCMKWRDMVHGCTLHTKRTETTAVSHGTSHVRTK